MNIETEEFAALASAMPAHAAQLLNSGIVEQYEPQPPAGLGGHGFKAVFRDQNGKRYEVVHSLRLIEGRA